MLSHLLESALSMFAEQGLDASIDDIITAADVSRGTFYNYFRTSHEVLNALGDALARELVELIEVTVGIYEDPVQRVGIGVRLFLKVAGEHPTFAAFLWRTAFQAAATVKVLRACLPRHIGDGIRQGRFDIDNADVGFHIVGGITLGGTFGLSTETVSRSYPDQIARCALLALGAARKDVDEALALPLPPLTFAEGSLFGRARKTKTA